MLSLKRIRSISSPEGSRKRAGEKLMKPSPKKSSTSSYENVPLKAKAKGKIIGSSFTLTDGSKTTKPIPFDASKEEVVKALKESGIVPPVILCDNKQKCEEK